jgi:hypothetical protein
MENLVASLRRCASFFDSREGAKTRRCLALLLLRRVSGFIRFWKIQGCALPNPLRVFAPSRESK